MTADPRCEPSDLPASMCAHCRGHDGGAAVTLHDVQVTHSIRARHPGRCALDSTHAIAEGDWIGSTDQGWICATCVERWAVGQ